MNQNAAHTTPRSEQKVVLISVLAEEDRETVDRVVFSDIPGHLVADHPWSATVLRRIGEDCVVRDYLATFAHTENGARRVLVLTLGLARMGGYEGTASAAALSVAGWCALSLGRWELADSLALRSLDAAHNSLAEHVREMVAGQWLAEVLDIESDFDTLAVRRCAERVLHELTERRAFVWLD